MASYTKEEDFYQDHIDLNEEYGMEERLVEALGSHIQDSVNQALIKALKPFTHPIFRYGQRKLWGRLPMVNTSRDDLAPDAGFAQKTSVGPSSSADILAQMAASVIKDHKYDLFPSLEASGSLPRMSSNISVAAESDSSLSSASQCREDPKHTGKRKRKSHNIEEENQTPKMLSFDLEAIIHPRSTEWVPCAEVAHYVQDRIRKSFDRDVRNTLRSECPRPSLLGKVAYTPELNPNLATFIKKKSKDPKKGLDGAWKGCQDKLLDISGPIIKILELVLQTKESNSPQDPDTIL
ncbi:hypothetical protein NDU88_003797, partial [Pleurodeles waltl]